MNNKYTMQSSFYPLPPCTFTPGYKLGAEKCAGYRTAPVELLHSRSLRQTGLAHLMEGMIPSEASGQKRSAFHGCIFLTASNF